MLISTLAAMFIVQTADAHDIIVDTARYGGAFRVGTSVYCADPDDRILYFDLATGDYEIEVGTSTGTIRVKSNGDIESSWGGINTNNNFMAFKSEATGPTHGGLCTATADEEATHYNICSPLLCDNQSDCQESCYPRAGVCVRLKPVGSNVCSDHCGCAPEVQASASGLLP